MSFWQNIVSHVADEYTSIAADGKASAEFSGFIDTGCYILNALLSGSIYGGLCNNRVTSFAGETSVGKTFLSLSLVKQFLVDNPEAAVFYYDSEASINKKLLVDRGIDPSRVIVAEPSTLQEFRFHAIKVVDNYMATPAKTRPKMMMVLDSLSQLSSTKEMEDTAKGAETKDMTKAQLTKGIFRVLNLKLARANIPFIVNAHVYDGQGLYAAKEISGGGGIKYTASSIVMLSKAKDREGTDVVGNIIHASMWKSRLSRENKKVYCKLSYTTGLDRYYGLLDLGERHGIFKKVSTRYEMPDGSKQFSKAIYENPEKYFTKEILDKLDEAAKKEFQYGTGED